MPRKNPKPGRKRAPAKGTPPPRKGDRDPADSGPEDQDQPWGRDGLTLKQRLFVQFYVGAAAGNATEAARMAGYRDASYLALRVGAHHTLTSPNVQRALGLEFGKRFGSAEDVRAGVTEIARGNAADYLAPDPRTGQMVIDLKKMAEAGALGLIHSIQDDITGSGDASVVTRRKLKLYDRLKALEILARMNGQMAGEVPTGPIVVKVVYEKRLPATPQATPQAPAGGGGGGEG